MRNGYDVTRRLEKVWRNSTLISTYVYDANGNRIAHITPTSVDSGVYDAQDRLLTMTHWPNGSVTQYSYTANGELKQKIDGADTKTYTYDYFGNLTKVVLPNGDVIEYTIDGQNRRIGKKLNGLIVKRWIYAGQLTPVAELDSARNVTARFVGNFVIKNDTVYQFITDHLGSVRMVVDVNSGSAAQRMDYDEFGNVVLDGDPGFTPFGFAGGVYDQHAKLTRLGARGYDPTIGRWSSKDPIGFAGRIANLYEYVLDDPVNLQDPNGTQPLGGSLLGPSYLARLGKFLMNYPVYSDLGFDVPVFVLGGISLDIQSGRKGIFVVPGVYVGSPGLSLGVVVGDPTEGPQSSVSGGFIVGGTATVPLEGKNSYGIIASFPGIAWEAIQWGFKWDKVLETYKRLTTAKEDCRK